MRLFNLAKSRADRLHRQAQAESEAGNSEAALALYEKCLAVDPERPATLYNIGLIHKYRKEWDKSLAFNSRAYALDSADEAVRWNLAIAATALRRWSIARKTWIACGIEMSDVDEPITMNFGKTPVRLNPDAGGEVVWGTRIDPVRVVIDSIPYPESGYRFADVVLHDGAPMGSRIVGEREYSVFNVLELFEPSKHSTYVASVDVPDPAGLERLSRIAADCGVEMEDWTATVRTLCKQCSEGVPHDAHDQEGNKAWNLERRIGLACEVSAQIDRLVNRCRNEADLETRSVALALRA